MSARPGPDVTPSDDDDTPQDPHAVRVMVVPGGVADDLPPLVVEPGRIPAGELETLDDEHLILVEGRPGGDRERILLLPPMAAAQVPRGVVRREVVIGGWRVLVDVEPAARAVLRERATRGRADMARSGPTEVRAIIPGVVISVSVTAGDTVAAGQQLLVIEAMKMHNELRTPRDGTIERVAVGPGKTIEMGDLLLVIA